MRYFNCLLLMLAVLLVQGCVPIVAGGVGASALVLSDRRTSGIIIEDQNIESKALGQIDAQYQKTVHVNVTSFNRAVLITGQVPNETIKADIGKLVSTLTNVKSVTNELQILALTDFSWRSNDAMITANIKMRFVSNGQGFKAENVKVVTENSSVFLMGLVYHKEADAATAAAALRPSHGIVPLPPPPPSPRLARP